MDGPALLFAIIFAGAFIWGVREQRMPMRWVNLDRRTNPAGFWLAAAGYAGASLLFLHMALAPVLR